MLLTALFFLIIFVVPQSINAATQTILPTVETSACRNQGDTCDDSAIWIHPTNPELSTIIGDDKNGGIIVWDITGKEIQYLDSSHLINNLDIRYNFPLSGNYTNGTPHTSVALVTAINESSNALNFYKVNPHTRILESIGAYTLSTALPYGGCMYLNTNTKKYYFFVNWKSGKWDQIELSPNGNSITARVVRSGKVNSQTEGCVADDIHQIYYLGEESTGVWRYGANPTDSTSGIKINGTELVADTEGMTIYYRTDGSGYLIVSSQGNSTFAVYERAKSQSEQNNKYIGSFTVGNSGSIDATSSTDGLDITNFPLGTSFPEGLLIVHDNANTGASSSNHKFVSVKGLSTTLGLTLDTSWDPRQVGAASQITPTSSPCTKKSQGDADCNGNTDLADFEIWRKEYLGLNGSITADFDNDTKISLSDFQSWRTGYFTNL